MKYHCNGNNTGNAISVLIVPIKMRENEQFIKILLRISLSLQKQILLFFILVKCNQVQQADPFSFSY